MLDRASHSQCITKALADAQADARAEKLADAEQGTRDAIEQEAAEAVE